MRQKIFACLCALSVMHFCLKAAAQDNEILVLWHANNTQTRVQLFTRPKITFEGDCICITSSVATLQYSVGDVLKFTYENVGSTGINAMSSNHSYRQNGCIYFAPSVRVSDVSLYSIDGHRLPVKLVQADAGISLPLSNIPSGPYILNINGQTIKFMKR